MSRSSSFASGFGLSLTIEPQQADLYDARSIVSLHVLCSYSTEHESINSNFGTITKDNLSIGPGGLSVDGVVVQTQVQSMEDLTDLNEVLGSGVSGAVRKMRHKTTGVVYALKADSVIYLAQLKAMHLDDSEEFIEKKLVELKTLLASNHPNIVGFHGAFYSSGTLSFVLEYMDRGTIADLLKAAGQIPEPILGRITLEFLRGLDYLHKKLHLIHRDIKPQNILLNRNGNIKITDFGVSGEIANTLALACTFVGTVKYMSPSRIKGEKHSAKSDIWSAGIVVLECALGYYPYGNDGPGTSFFSRLNDIANKPAPIPPSSTFSKEFLDFISMCLQKEEANLPDCQTLMDQPFIRLHENVDARSWILQLDYGKS